MESLFGGSDSEAVNVSAGTRRESDTVNRFVASGTLHQARTPWRRVTARELLMCAVQGWGPFFAQLLQDAGQQNAKRMKAKAEVEAKAAAERARGASAASGDERLRAEPRAMVEPDFSEAIHSGLVFCGGT